VPRRSANDRRARLGSWLLNSGIGLVAILILVLVASALDGVMEARGTHPPPPPPGAAPVEPVRVEVLNGCGVSGAAKAAASVLRAAEGGDVVTIGNAHGARIAHTIVIDRGGRREAAMHVARVLGGEETQVVYQRAARPGADVTVIVGYDDGRWEVPFAVR
jgi:hypothetical protein